MPIKTNFLDGGNPVDVLRAFEKQARAPYEAVYVKLGNGRHSFGHAEFHTMQGLADEIRDASRVYRLNQDKYLATLTASTAIITFQDKAIHSQFMNAMLGKNVPRPTLTVQISNQSREWHQAAGSHLAYIARQRHEANLPPSPVHQKTVIGFGHMLVDYTFSNITMMQDFCAAIMSDDFRNRARAMRSATQPHLRALKKPEV
jgi:hypothetical protein